MRTSLLIAHLAVSSILASGMLHLPAANAAGIEGQSSEQPEAVADDDQIIVTGSRLPPADLRTFVDAIVGETANDRVARWADRLCLTFVGVSPQLRTYFGGKLAKTAKLLGLDVSDDEKCGPAAYVIFTSQPDAVVADLERSGNDFLGKRRSSDRTAFLTSSTPVRWHSGAALRGDNGEQPVSFYIDPKYGGVERPVPGVTSPASRLRSGGRMDVQSMLVVVDTTRVSGISNRSLAAYLSMIILGNISPEPQSLAYPSILKMFDNVAERTVITDDLSRWDLAYLKALYSGPWDMAAGLKAGQIKSRMREELQQRSAAEENPPG